MKPTKHFTLILALVLPLALAACGDSGIAQPGDADTSAMSEEVSETTATTATTGSPPATTGQPATVSGHAAVPEQPTAPEPPAEASAPAPPAPPINEGAPDADNDSSVIHVDSASVKEFREFLASEKEKGTDLSPYFLLPKAPFPGYELDCVSYEMNGAIRDMDGTVRLTYRHSQAQGADITYFIYTWNLDLAQESLRQAAAANTKRLDIEGRDIYYSIDSGLYIFTYIQDDKLVNAFLPVVDGAHASEMLAYLDMASAA